jgi:Abnormal spindle-like microcephaly-assoc'd, ASPM-SPD-2-Hydin
VERTLAVDFGRIRTMAVFLVLAGAFLVLADHAIADETEVDTTPPAFLSSELSPGSLSYEGGNVQIRVEIVDESGVQMTTAQVYGSDGSYQAIQLYEGYKDNYFGTLEAPANYSDSPVTYSVEVQAYDLENNFNAGSIGEVQVEGQPRFDEAPYISTTELWPQFLPAAGGTVTIGAEAGDNSGLSAVYAMITPVSSGSSSGAGLNAVSSSHFEGTYEVPANTGFLAAEYLVEVVVQDDIGQEARAGAGTITVEAAPPPLSSGLLAVRPAERAFGSVAIGKKAERVVVVRNLARDGGEPVAATGQIAGSSGFSISGAPTGGLHFVLAPGEKRRIAVVFQPTAAGRHSGLLEIVRDDGGQTGLAVELSGRGRAGLS